MSGPGRFRKKPVEIEAWRFVPEAECESISTYLQNSLDLTEWCGGRSYAMRQPECNPHILIETLEGDMEAHEGDWIIKGVQGEFYPCKPDIFTATYEVA